MQKGTIAKKLPLATAQACALQIIHAQWLCSSVRSQEVIASLCSLCRFLLQLSLIAVRWLPSQLLLTLQAATRHCRVVLALWCVGLRGTFV